MRFTEEMMEIIENNSLTARVEEALGTMRPYLNADGGDVELVEIDSEMNVLIRLLGQCKSCSMSHMTMKAGIEEGIRRAVPEVRNVIALTDN
jgi:Fe-S cluster biogenesis protein NfuA